MDVFQTDPFVLETDGHNTAVGQTIADIVSSGLIVVENDCGGWSHIIIQLLVKKTCFVLMLFSLWIDSFTINMPVQIECSGKHRSRSLETLSICFHFTY